MVVLSIVTMSSCGVVYAAHAWSPLRGSMPSASPEQCIVMHTLGVLDADSWMRHIAYKRRLISIYVLGTTIGSPICPSVNLIAYLLILINHWSIKVNVA